jgi:hypothetical protein
MIQGEDKAISITITDSAGALQSIDALTDLIVYISTRGGSAPLIKYKKVVAEGFAALLRVSSTVYIAIFPKEISGECNVDDLLIEVEIQESDSRFVNSIRRTKGKGLIDVIEKTIITE